jgi:hypothetical protein
MAATQTGFPIAIALAPAMVLMVGLAQPVRKVYILTTPEVNMNKEQKLSGGCLCGAVRYEASGQPFAVSHCHCRTCRKHNGAPVVTLAGYSVDQVTFSGTARSFYASSPGVARAFCANCGTPLTWEGDAGELGRILEIHISTFDNPEALAPTAHAFYPERISWFDIADDLPRFAGFADEGEPLCHGPG